MENKEIESLKKELEGLKVNIQNQQESDRLKAEISQLRDQVKQAEFRKNHSTLFYISSSLSRGTKRLFGGIGRGLNRMSKNIEKNNTAERIKQNNDKLNNALNGLD